MLLPPSLNATAKFCWPSAQIMRIKPVYGNLPAVKSNPAKTRPQALVRELREELGIDATPGVYIASHQRDVSGRRIHLHAWHVPAFNGLIRALEHQALAWCTPEEALEYPLAPADIPLLQAFMALRDARLTDSC